MLHSQEPPLSYTLNGILLVILIHTRTGFKMFYTKMGRIAVDIAFALGLLRIAMGLAVATGTIVEPDPGHYLGNNTSGEAIDQGIHYVLFAIILGVITDISRSVAKGQARS